MKHQQFTVLSGITRIAAIVVILPFPPVGRTKHTEHGSIRIENDSAILDKSGGI